MISNSSQLGAPSALIGDRTTAAQPVGLTALLGRFLLRLRTPVDLVRHRGFFYQFQFRLVPRIASLMGRAWAGLARALPTFDTQYAEH